jgi:protein-S-isoprenylcysteine O-methyltransferase Ste14
MAVGTALAVANLPLMIAISAVYAGIYHFIILDEETKLQRIFGEPYAWYCAAVPRFFPRIFPPFGKAPKETLARVNPDPDHARFNRELARKNKAYEAYATFVALIGLVALIAQLRAWIF